MGGSMVIMQISHLSDEPFTEDEFIDWLTGHDDRIKEEEGLYDLLF